MSIQSEPRLQQQWESVFKSKGWGKYPSEELIRFVARHYYQVPKRDQIHFLDLGCGLGACAWYLAKEGFTVTGLDGSPSAIEQARFWFERENLSAQFDVGDLEALPYSAEQFDVAVDNGGLTSNPLPVVKTILAEVRRVLKPGGRYYGMFLGQESTAEGERHPEDGWHFQKPTSGPLSRAATFRLFSEPELRALFLENGFQDITIDYHVRTLNNQAEKVQTWTVVAH